MLSSLTKQYWITHANSACRKVPRVRSLSPSPRKDGGIENGRLTLRENCARFTCFYKCGCRLLWASGGEERLGKVKHYCVLFTCMASSAVHLEVPYALDTDSCINAIHRFMCHRGQVTHLTSDNGTNLIEAERELREAIAEFSMPYCRVV